MDVDLSVVSLLRTDTPNQFLQFVDRQVPPNTEMLMCHRNSYLSTCGWRDSQPNPRQRQVLRDPTPYTTSCPAVMSPKLQVQLMGPPTSSCVPSAALSPHSQRPAYAQFAMGRPFRFLNTREELLKAAVFGLRLVAWRCRSLGHCSCTQPNQQLPQVSLCLS